MSYVNEEAAALVVERYRHAKFEWGLIDCLHFASDFVDARLGTDYLHRIEAALPPYHSAIEAIRMMHALAPPGAEPLEAWDRLVTGFVGPSAPVSEAAFGDVVLGHDDPPQERCLILGICDEEKFMAPSAHGLVWLNMSNALRVWKCHRR